MLDLKIENKEEYEKYFHDLLKEIKGIEDPPRIIKKVLDAALNFYNADRSYIFEADDELAMGINTYEVCAPGVESQIENLQEVGADVTPRWGAKLKCGESMMLNDIEDLKDEYQKEYELLKMQDITSLIAIPFERRGVVGYIGVGNPKKHKEEDTFLHDLSYVVLTSLIEYYLKKDLISSTKNENVKMEKDVYIKTFGNFRIDTYLGTFNEEDITSKLCFILFTYLLINRKNISTANELAQILWPNQEDYEPYDYLRNLVFRTRKMFRSFIGEELIIAKDGSYTCNDKINFIIDYEIVEKLYHETLEQNSEEVLLENYEKIVELYEGDILPKINSEIWMISIVEKYKSIYIEVVEKYLQILYANKKYIKMLKTCERAISIYSNIGSFHYYSILAYIGEKKYAVAQSYFDKAGNLLGEEYINKLKQQFNVAR